MAAVMNFLLDSNVLIAAYPMRAGSVEPLADLASELIRLANEHGHTTYSHPIAIQYDIGNIQDEDAREWRRHLIGSHPNLQFTPSIQTEISLECGDPDHGSNDWVDHNLLAAVVGDAVNFLVTEDRRILSKGTRLGLGERVIDIEDAITVIRALAPQPSSPLLLARQVEAQALDEHDPIFDSLREDYPEFNNWLSKCKQEHRTSWVIRSGDNLAAATIVKHETPAEYGIEGQTLKIAMFKVSEYHPGMRYGELLLKSVFDFLVANSYERAYVTVLPKHFRVVDFFENFGFERIEVETPLGEDILVKSFVPSPGDRIPNLEYHIRYGPRHYRTDATGFIVPIVPQYHRVLFPELETQGQFEQMREMSPFGNSILKAYLSTSSIRSINVGDILYFYRSEDLHALTTVGIVEGTRVSRSADQIASYVGKRTVYSHQEIDSMAIDGREVLAILFRQAGTIDPPISDRQLREGRIWSRPSQSTMTLSTGGVEWIEAMGRMAR